MNRKFAAMLAVCAGLLFAACGGDNHSHNGNSAHNHAGNSQGHGHGDEHGEAHELGEKKVGDYELHVSQVESDKKDEGVFEVKVMKDGKAVKDVPVEVWIGNSAGKELAPVAKGEWMEEEGLFDCHAMLPKDMAEARLWVRIRPAGVKLDAVDFELDKD